MSESMTCAAELKLWWRKVPVCRASPAAAAVPDCLLFPACREGCIPGLSNNYTDTCFSFLTNSHILFFLFYLFFLSCRFIQLITFPFCVCSRSISISCGDTINVSLAYPLRQAFDLEVVPLIIAFRVAQLLPAA